MENKYVRCQLEDMRKALLDEELLNEQFIMMEDVEECRRNNIVERCMALYFDHCSLYIDQVEKTLIKDRIDFEAMHIYLSRLKKESHIVGANKVAIKAADMKACKSQGNILRLKQALQEIKGELQALRDRLVPYFHLLRMVGPPDAAERPLEDIITSS